MSSEVSVNLLKWPFKSEESFSLTYGMAPTKFGNCLAAFKDNTLCYLTFYDADPPIEKLQKVWNTAMLVEDNSQVSPKIHKLFSNEIHHLQIYMKGTDFEMAVWEELLKIKPGGTVSYADVAVALRKPKAVRAAARAVAKNNVAYFIPCHRVIKKNGSIHKYGCGSHRKVLMLTDEGAIK